MHTIAEGRVRHRIPFRAVAGFGAVAVALSSLAMARPASEAACRALAARVGQAVELKAKGTPIDKAVSGLSARTPEDGILGDAQAAYFDRQLPGAVRFAYVAGMSAGNATAYYLKQCRTGG
jgi:hypothetical protein